ncbi:hypothetical protein M1555_04155 [Patescibacteria group bacterium]|nr:hypothetical protein [Patescibacteria group bacterium]
MRLAEYGSGSMVIVPNRFTPNGFRDLGDVAFNMPTASMHLAPELVTEFGADVYEKMLHEDSGIVDWSPPPDKEIGGVVLVVYTDIDHHPYILVSRERRDKPENDKYFGDYSVVAETRRPGEMLEVTRARAIIEEMGWAPEMVQVSRRVIGHYFINQHVWVEARMAYVPNELIAVHPVEPNDNETDTPLWVHPLTYLGGFPARAGMLTIVAHGLKGWHDVVALGSAGRREDVAFTLFSHDPPTQRQLIMSMQS